MQILRTEQTYKTIANAEKALTKALKKVGLAREQVHYFIGAREVDGEARFAPAVRHDAQGEHHNATNELMFEGVTIF